MFLLNSGTSVLRKNKSDKILCLRRRDTKGWTCQTENQTAMLNGISQ